MGYWLEIPEHYSNIINISVYVAERYAEQNTLKDLRAKNKHVNKLVAYEVLKRLEEHEVGSQNMCRRLFISHSLSSLELAREYTAFSRTSLITIVWPDRS